jgi:hypothetical protein
VIWLTMLYLIYICHSRTDAVLTMSSGRRFQWVICLNENEQPLIITQMIMNKRSSKYP